MDKAELIRHEIEKRRDHNLAIGNPLFAAMAEEDIELLLFIDSMQKESVSDEQPSVILYGLTGSVGSPKEEPVSEDLEVELKNYLNSDEYINTLGVSGYLLIARHFANWQKNKMMEDAVDGEVGYWNQRGLSVNMDLPRTLKEDDKVKLVIIKEDKV